MKYKYTFLMIAAFICQLNLQAQLVTQKEALQKVAISYKAIADANRAKAYTLAKLKHWDTTKSSKRGYAQLIGVNNHNHPVYYTTYNTDVAATLSTNQLWPGGSSGLSLNGSSSNMKNTLAIWDGGRVLDTHRELIGRITRMDSSYYDGDGSDHATHVSGTMIATGVDPVAKGMAFAIPNLLTFDFNNDISEISNQVGSGLLFSNHSYGDICGWYNDPVTGVWEFWGNAGDTIDYNFGLYDQDASTIDGIVYSAPYYSHVRAAGNSRDQNGPPVGQDYYRYDSSGNMVDAGPRPVGISSNSGYTIIPTTGNAKNIITVGAVSELPTGYVDAAGVIMTSFSGWGPTDDGRIKPDLVSDGIDVTSCISTSDSDYETMSGTSMATPGITGSLVLLQQYYSQLNSGNFMHASTLKGLAIHTADEAGAYLGPNYMFGWGVMNSLRAAEAIKVSNSTGNSSNSQYQIYENVLNNGQTFTQSFTATGKGTVKATICWTDPAASAETVDATHKPSPRLVNDLDLRITKGARTYYPWVLNPTVPAAAATKGDNHLDNVEQIEMDSLVTGQVYTITISHKGTLTNGLQAYALLITQPTASLPLKLLQFTASSLSNLVLLQWLTANELDAKMFLVERSTDANNWDSITTVASKNSSQGSKYFATDKTPSAGTFYYRLKMINTDGSYTFSQIVSVKVGQISSEVFTLGPNPASNQATLNFSNTIKQAAISLFNEEGKSLLRTNVDLRNSNVYTLNTSQLAAGTYLLNVQTSAGVFTKKLVVKK